MDSKSVLRIEPKGSGFLVIKDGGSSEFVYARATKAEVKAIIDETYPDEGEAPTKRLLPPHTQALIERSESDGDDLGLKAGEAELPLAVAHGIYQ